MTALISDDVIIPAQLGEMIKRLSGGSPAEDERYQEYLDYVAGWVAGRAHKEYAKLVARDGLPQDPRVIALLCELAVMRALVSWHEIRDRQPPMPRICNL
jgi:hypothetical protein